MNNLYFTSDTHFWHTNILKYNANRKYGSIEEMNEDIISKWNSKVKPKDTIYHLGDVAFCNTGRLNAIFSRLNGHKHLIRGNHDRKSFKLGSSKHFETIRDYHEINFGRNKLVMCHYPFYSWNKSHHGSWHVFGHRHGSLDTGDVRSMDVGVDTNNMYPYHFDEVSKYMNSLPLPYPPGHKRYDRG